MGHLLEGVWSTEDHFPTDKGGRFVRKSASFRNWVKADGSTPYEPEAGRYHLYVSYACPWAHRTLIARSLLGLEDVVSVSVCHPLMLEQGWVFADGKAEIPDTVNGIDYLHQLYTKADAAYTGRATVPVLWDKKTGTLVNNESRDILRMFTTEFRSLWTRELDLAPADLIPEIDETAASFYNAVNNGVYRSGFARTQQAYEEAVTQLFEALDGLEQRLSKHRFLVGNRLTEADICLFPTLLRFDPVYVTHFKCNLRRLVDYPNLWGFTRDVYQTAGVAKTCDLRHIKEHYFGSHESVNPFRIVPVGPVLDLGEPHGRESLGL